SARRPVPSWCRRLACRRRENRSAHGVTTLPLTPSTPMTRLVVATVVALLFTAARAAAHPVPFSYVDASVQQGAIELTLVAHVFDVAHDLGVSPPERLLEPGLLAERGAEIARMLAPRLALSADGRPLGAIEVSTREPLVDRP